MPANDFKIYICGLVSALSRQGLVVAFLVGFGASLARAGNVLYTGAASTEALDHFSYVRDGGVAGVRGPNIVEVGFTYPGDVNANTKAGSVDNVFVQCYGGGFVPELLNGGPAKMTATSGSLWSEPVLNLDPLDMTGKIISCDNFVRAWRDSVSAGPNKGFLNWYKVASGQLAAAGVNQDPFSPPGYVFNGKTYLEHPMYATPDNPVGGANDTRTLAPGNPPPPNAYAILVAWDRNTAPGDQKHLVNLARIYWLLRNAPYNVPLDNIVVLNSGATFGQYLPNYNYLDPAINGAVFEDGDNTSANWTSALQGKLFTTGGMLKGTNVPGPSDKLFILNTGHGDQIYLRSIFAPIVGGFKAILNLVSDGFATVSSTADPEFETVANSDGNVILQLQLSQQINPDATISVSGVASSTAGSALVTSPTSIYNYNSFVNSAYTPYTYQLSLPETALNSNASSLTLSLSGLQSQYSSNSNLVLVASLIGGDQETAYDNNLYNGYNGNNGSPATVPLPPWVSALLAVLILASAIFVFRRKRVLPGCG